MANAPEIISIALKVRPEIVCIVPERRLEVTTEADSTWSLPKNP